MILPNDRHANYAADWSVRRQKRFVNLRDRLAVDRALGRLPAAPPRNRGDRLPTHVEHGQKRQGQRAESRMPHGQRERHPDVPVEIFLVGRTRRGIAMDVGPFGHRAIPFSGRVVDHRQQPIRQRQRAKPQDQQPAGDDFGLASECRQEVIIVSEVRADPCGSEPSGDGPSPSGEEYSRQKDRQSPAISGVQTRRQPQAPFVPVFRTPPTTFCIRHLWLSYHFRCGKRLVIEEPFSLQDQF